MRSVLTASFPPPGVRVALGPADLGLNDVEAVLDVLRQYGGEPGITRVDRHGLVRVTELATQPDAVLKQLVLESADGDVWVVLGNRESHVYGPWPAAERIWEIVDARRTPLRRNPILWVPTLFPGFYATLLLLLGGWMVPNIDGDPRWMLVLLVVLAVAALYTYTLYREIARLRREESRRSIDSARFTGGGRVRIRRRADRG
jgi:hypothetical protein